MPESRDVHTARYCVCVSAVSGRSTRGRGTAWLGCWLSYAVFGTFRVRIPHHGLFLCCPSFPASKFIKIGHDHFPAHRFRTQFRAIRHTKLRKRSLMRNQLVTLSIIGQSFSQSINHWTINLSIVGRSVILSTTGEEFSQSINRWTINLSIIGLSVNKSVVSHLVNPSVIGQSVSLSIIYQSVSQSLVNRLVNLSVIGRSMSVIGQSVSQSINQWPINQSISRWSVSYGLLIRRRSNFFFH